MADDIVKEALEIFDKASQSEEENRSDARDDIRFARLAKQWDEGDISQRALDRRPCLVINKLPAFIRQVINDSRMSNPSIKTHPVDSDADPDTAKIIDGLIRNIEVTSSADIAYDTGIDQAVTSGFGYWRIEIDYSNDDSFDQDIFIRPITNQFSVYGDPSSTSSDSSDWNHAFIIQQLPKTEFKNRFKSDSISNWEIDYEELPPEWLGSDFVTLAEYFRRTETEGRILQLSNGEQTIVVEDTVYEAQKVEIFDALGMQVTGDRAIKKYKVTHYLMSGKEVFKETPWVGKYIPIVPIYGEEIYLEGKRYLRSLVRDAKDPQRMFNYWRTSSTELVALAPKAPYIGPSGAFTTDHAKWKNSNVRSYPYLEYDGSVPPQRQPFSGIPAGALQEALNASDDMKAIIGIYDAGLGARSNETSGRAIIARQKESDTSTFHFIDNRDRSIRHTGRIIVDLIPHVYNKPRMVRVMGGENMDVPRNIQINKQFVEKNAVKIYDLTVGKYDVTVTSGPSFSTRREEAANQMVEMIRAFPNIAPLIGDILASSLDWPGADRIAARLKTLLPPEAREADVEDSEDEPEVAALKAQMQQMQQQAVQVIQQLAVQIKSLEDKANSKSEEIAVKKLEATIKMYEAETNRMKAENDARTTESDASFKAVDQILKANEAAARVPEEKPPTGKRSGTAKKNPDGSWTLTIGEAETGESTENQTTPNSSED